MVTAAVVTACGSSGGGNSQQAADPTGNYTAMVNMKDALNKSMESTGIAFSSDINVEVGLELKSNGKYTLSLDPEKFANTIVDVFKADGKAIMEQSLEAQGIGADEINTYVSALGYDSLDGLIEVFAGEMGEQMKTSMSEAKTEGTYKIEGSKLTLEGGEGGISASEGTINSDGTITINADLSEVGTIEMVFKK